MAAEHSLIAALRSIANGTKLDPIQQDPATELARVDRIAMQAIAEYEAHIAGAHDPEDDALDGILFRFWIRAASLPGGWPSYLVKAIDREIQIEGFASPAAYRRALIGLAKEKGVNLPGGAS